MARSVLKRAVSRGQLVRYFKHIDNSDTFRHWVCASRWRFW